MNNQGYNIPRMNFNGQPYPPYFPIPAYMHQYIPAHPIGSIRQFVPPQPQMSETARQLQNLFMEQNSIQNEQSSENSGVPNAAAIRKGQDKVIQNNFINLVKNLSNETKNDLKDCLLQDLNQNENQVENEICAESKKEVKNDIENDKIVNDFLNQLTIDKPKQVPKEDARIVENVEKIDEEPQIESKPSMGRLVNERRVYSVVELMRARNFDNTKVAIKIPKTENNRLFLRTERVEKVIYKRSQNAWVSADERFKTLSKDQLTTEKCRIQIQRAINKYSKNTESVVQKEILGIPIKDIPMANFLIECIYKCVVTNSTWACEIARFCSVLDKSFSFPEAHFISLLIDKFLEGTNLPKEWIENYESIKSRKVTTVEELDLINEELQLYEQNIRLVLVGSAKFIAYLNISGMLPAKVFEKFTTKCISLKHDLEMEMVCAFADIILKNQQKIPQSCRKVFNELIKHIKDSMANYSMRVQFIMGDVLAIQNKMTKNDVKITSIKSSESAKDIMMRPETRTAQRGPRLPATGSFQFSSQKPAKTEYFQSKDTNPAVKTQTFMAKVPVLVKNKEMDPDRLKKDDAAIEEMLGRFAAEFEAEKFSDELKDYELSNHMQYFIKKCFNLFVIKSRINHLYFGNLLCLMVRQGRLETSDIFTGLSDFLEDFDDSIEDFPKLHECIAKCLLKLILLDIVKVDEVLAVFKSKGDFVLEKCAVGLFYVLGQFTCTSLLFKFWKTSKMDASLRKKIEDQVSALSDAQKGGKMTLIIENTWDHGIKIQNDLLNPENSLWKDRLGNLIDEFFNLFFFICPMTREEFTEKFVIKCVGTHSNMIKILMSDEGRIQAVHQKLNDLLKSTFAYPPYLVSYFFKGLVKNNICDLNTVETYVAKINNKVVQEEFKFFKASPN